MASCPLKSSKEWKELVAARGEYVALALWDLYEGNVPESEYGNEIILLQKEELPSTPASPATINKIKQAAKKMGINIDSLSVYLKKTGLNITGVNALADILYKTVAIAEGKEDVALTEEVVHVATAILEQTNPNKMTEMISKIGNYKIYKTVYEQYKNDKNYQTPDGKPDIRKIKKEAVDRLITELILYQAGDTANFPELADETLASVVRNWWETILDWISNLYKQSGVDLFEEVVKDVIEGNIENVESLQQGIFAQKSEPTNEQKAFVKKINETRKLVRKVEGKEKPLPILMDTEEASNWYEHLVGGVWKRVKKRVTDRVKHWYMNKFPGKIFTDAEKEFNELKRKHGVKFHSFLQEIHALYFDPITGERRDNVKERPVINDPVDAEIFRKLDNYFVELMQQHFVNGNTPLVFSELTMYDEREDEAGTIDLLIIDEDGVGHIYDWKFMNVGAYNQDVPWFKQGAFDIQLRRYKNILLERYGVKKIGRNRAIPILMKIEAKKDEKAKITGVVVGSADPSKIESFLLLPVAEKTESTGHNSLDKLIGQLNDLHDEYGKKKTKSDDEHEFKVKTLNLIRKSIRAAQIQGDIRPLVELIKGIREDGDRLMNTYLTTYKNADPHNKDIKKKDLSDFAAQLREYHAIANIFNNITTHIGSLIYNEEMEKEAVTEEEKNEIAERKEVLADITKEEVAIRKSAIEVEEMSKEFADKFVGQRNLVFGLLDPEAIIRGLAGTFNSISTLPAASLRILYKLVFDARADATRDAFEEVKQLMAIREKLSKRGGDLRAIVQQLYQKDDNDKLVNKLIYKYKKEFYDGIKNNSLEGKRDREWLIGAINLDEYMKEANEKIQTNIEYIKKKHEDKDLIEKLTKDEYRKWDVTRKDFIGWDNYLLRHHPKNEWLSEEYKAIQKDPELFELYQFIMKMNDKAVDSGYIENKARSTFLPFIRKSMAESLAWDFEISSVKNWGNSLKIDATTVGYGNINKLTNRIEHSLPRYFTEDFSLQEDGTRDYSDVSEDLFKNMILYINHMEKYKYLSEVEDQLKLIKDVERFKNHHLATNRIGGVILKEGEASVEKGNEENEKMYDTFMRAVLFEEKYPDSPTDSPIGQGVIEYMKWAINKVAGKEIYAPSEQPSAISMMKSIDMANRAFQLKTLGLDFISGSVNWFGGNIQALTQSGDYFKGKEFFANQGKLMKNAFKNDNEREMFIQLVNAFMPMRDDPTYDVVKSAGMSRITHGNFSDFLMVFMRKPEQLLEKSIFLSLLDNVMVVEGKLVSIPKYVKNKYKDRYDVGVDRKAIIKKMEDEIKSLKETKSITATKQLVDGNLVIPGFDLNNTNELNKLTRLTRRMSRNATGGMSDQDRAKSSMNIFLNSMMVFKNWIPKLWMTRFGKLEKTGDDFTIEIGEDGMPEGEKYDIGRVRLFSYFLGLNLPKTARRIHNILALNEDGIAEMDEMYMVYSKKYKDRTGKTLNMTREDFFDMVRINLHNQVRELTLLLSLFGIAMSMGFMSPPDDADKATKNFYRYSQRVVDKFIQELSFFYNPVEFQKILSGGTFPAIGIFSDIEKFSNHFFMQTTGIDFSDYDATPEETRKKAQPIKYGAKMFPITKSLMTYGAIFSDEFAKEFDITIQKETKR